MKRSWFTKELIIGVLKGHQAGSTAADLCRKHGISDETFYASRSKYGGMGVLRNGHRCTELPARSLVIGDGAGLVLLLDPLALSVAGDRLSDRSDSIPRHDRAARKLAKRAMPNDDEAYQNVRSRSTGYGQVGFEPEQASTALKSAFFQGFCVPY
jgi:hypothetical protein